MRKLAPGIVFILLALTACSSAKDEFKVVEYKACLENAYNEISKYKLSPDEANKMAQARCASFKP